MATTLKSVALRGLLGTREKSAPMLPKTLLGFEGAQSRSAARWRFASRRNGASEIRGKGRHAPCRIEVGRSRSKPIQATAATAQSLLGKPHRMRQNASRASTISPHVSLPHGHMLIPFAAFNARMVQAGIAAPLSTPTASRSADAERFLPTAVQPPAFVQQSRTL